MIKKDFVSKIQEGYHSYKGSYFTIGSGILGNTPLPETDVRIPLKTLNRHGLIAGATGTGKTVTLQVFAEQLSTNGIPVLLMDLKGDLSGIGAEGTPNKHTTHRHSFISVPYTTKAFPLEFFSLSDEIGSRLRATVTEFGPLLMSKVLDINSTQQSILSVIFKYCDDNSLPLIDLADFKKVLQFSIAEGKEEFTKHYGNISSSSVATILRKVIELEHQGGDQFFGELSFDTDDLVSFDENGNGIISIIRLADIKDKPKLFTTFMLSLLAEIYATFPEEGDLDKPKLCLFIDEAHLVFKDASKELLDQIESIIKLIRSKGVGVFFCTQNPNDIPDAVLGQLGMKIQHALRAFTAKDRKEIAKTAENFPLSDFYKTDEVLTNMGIGEALITVLNEKGIPTPLVKTLMRSPMSRMGVLEQKELDAVLKKSKFSKKYNETIDRESAFEILSKKLETAQNNAEEEKEKPKNTSKESSFIETISKNTMVRQVGRTIARELMRGLLGVLGVKKTSSRRRKR